MGIDRSSLPDGMPLPQNVLVLEDQVLIAFDLEECLRHLGVGHVRLTHRIAEALAKIEQMSPDFALLDVWLGKESSFPVARTLKSLGIRFAFLTGYDGELPNEEFAASVRIEKPYTPETLQDGIMRATTQV
jgi:CheY-like chemotaxis protein